ncbi:MAG: hypothetical protein RDU14_17480 [Melioribacteraceae bacterium]|nr:hypothetical protein [Melioribacteraceae bacterium]
MIMGLQNPKIKIGVNEIELNDAIMHPDFISPIIFENTSPINGERKFIYLGDHSSFRLEIDMMDYATPGDLFNLGGQLGVFYPHKDNDAIKDLFGNDVLFMVMPVQLFYKNNDIRFDTCFLTLLSVGFVDYKGHWNILGYGYQFAYNFGYGV